MRRLGWTVAALGLCLAATACVDKGQQVMNKDKAPEHSASGKRALMAVDDAGMTDISGFVETEKIGILGDQNPA